ncbi:MAG: superoxide dismutase [Alphaproteobacteria bacterium]
MAFKLPQLPYAMDALKPHISAETLEYHYGKHHQAYVTNLNNLTEGKPEANQSLEEIIKKASGGLFNNAAQVYNHTFYWNCLSPSGGGEAKGPSGDAIKRAFGDFASFKEKFTAASVTLFGSGWAWLVRNPDGSIAIEQTANAGCPLTKDQKPLLTCDVWEHAYYIDYRNLRPKYVEAFWNLVNWEFVNQNLR